MQTAIHYFRWSFIVTILGLALSGWVGWAYLGTLGGVFTFVMLGAVLAALEISLSFDNAIVNANKLQAMEPIWQKRFLTWGIVIAVFGMRIVFPLLIVVVAAGIGPWEAIMLAVNHPESYAKVVGEAHLAISAFGGSFLMMVGLTFFISEAKEIDWIAGIERSLRRWGSIRGLEIGFVLTIVLVIAGALPGEKVGTFVYAAMAGLLTFLAVEVVSHVLDARESKAMLAGAKGAFGAFLYLEVLDASFSFDGVIGAFALTNNLFLIAIGLGVGAMYVRSMTIMLVERKTLVAFRYLENGAFWSILVLAVIMFAQSLWHIPEVVTGLLGVCFIGLSLISSIRYNRAHG